MEDYKKISDEDLVIEIRKKDKQLYAEIVTRYQDKLMRYANYLINDEQKAADVVQEAFIKAYINLNSFNTKKKFSAWIYRIAHNEAMNAVKKYHKEIQMDEDMDFTDKINLEEEFDKKSIIEMAGKCLSDMPIKYSEPLELFFLEEKSYEEIGEILRLPGGTVATRINRGKVLMKKICQKK